VDGFPVEPLGKVDITQQKIASPHFDESGIEK
jgi:uncharacterized protein (DUF2141 family)